MRWNGFARACPELATLVRDRFEREQIFLLGTLRLDGSPRISAVECDFVDGDLMTSMIWRSAKAVDIEHDDRFTVHSLVPDKAHEAENEGDLKLYGRAVPVTEPTHKRRYEDAIHARIGWRPPEPYHCFAFDIERAGMVRFAGDVREVRGWRAGGQMTVRHLPALGHD